MKRYFFVLSAALCLVSVANLSFAGGFKGKVAGAARGGGSFNRSGGRASVPNLGGGSFNRPSGGSPSFNRPAGGAPSFNRPSGGTPSFNRPPGGSPSFNRPSGGTPSFNLPNKPGGGMKPSTRPNLPSSLPNRPAQGKPDFGGGKFDDLKGKWPETRPSTPNLGGGNRPSFGGGNIGGGNRPSRDQVGDFLNLKDSIHAPKDKIANRPDFNVQNRASTKQSRVINFGDVNLSKTNVINNRPTWANIDQKKKVDINKRWTNQIGGVRNWNTKYPARVTAINNWGNSIRYPAGRWGSNRLFGSTWWVGHGHPIGGWHYGYQFKRYPPAYWWTVPTFVACSRWFTWTAPAGVWNEPLYYDYGDGGNVTYSNNVVYVDGEGVATADDFAESAMDLATAPAPASEAEAAAAEWLPLGVFAVSSSESDVSPTRVVQLAVSKEGIVSGTLYNAATDQTSTIQGRVDKETQRVAMRLGESESIVMETGLYNLTQDNASLLVHFGTTRVENWLLVRLEDEDAAPSQP